MTIALGVLANNGAILAADTEVTWNYLKTSGTKITYATENGAIAVTGAGWLTHVEAASQGLIDIFKKESSAPIAELEPKFGAGIKRFYKEQIIPFASFPNEERPAFELIIAAQRGGETRLWATSRTALCRRSDYAAVGTGNEYASALFERLFNPAKIDRTRINTETASLLATYVTLFAKEHVQGCGKKTQVVRLDDNTATPLQPPCVEMMEYHFSRYSEVQAMEAQYIMGYPFTGTKQIDHLISQLTSLKAHLDGLQRTNLVGGGWTLDADE